MPWHFEKGASYHCISHGDVDSLTYLRVIVKQQPIEYVLISTWCMAITDVKEVEKWLERKDIGHADFYVGEIFQGSYADVYLYLKKVAERFGSRVCIFRNHAKVMAGFGNAFDFVLESSANINTNPRTEQTCLTLDNGLACFYKEFYDEDVYKRQVKALATGYPVEFGKIALNQLLLEGLVREQSGKLSLTSKGYKLSLIHI